MCSVYLFICFFNLFIWFFYWGYIFSSVLDCAGFLLGIELLQWWPGGGSYLIKPLQHPNISALLEKISLPLKLLSIFMLSTHYWITSEIQRPPREMFGNVVLTKEEIAYLASFLALAAPWNWARHPGVGISSMRYGGGSAGREAARLARLGGHELPFDCTLAWMSYLHFVNFAFRGNKSIV